MGLKAVFSPNVSYASFRVFQILVLPGKKCEIVMNYDIEIYTKNYTSMIEI